MDVATMRRPHSDQLAEDFVGFVHAFGVLRSELTAQNNDRL
jgi:hypothetical protein